MSVLAARLAGLQGWRRYGTAWLLGALAAAALPPVHAVPLLVVSFTGLLWLLDGAGGTRRSFLVAWAFAWGHFVAGLYWIGIAFLVDAARFAWLLPFPVLGLPALLAIFPAATLAAAERLRLAGAARLLALAVAWTAAEYARGHLFTGFPWNLTGYAWTVSESMLQSVSVIGVYGLGLLTVVLAGLPSLFAAPGIARRHAWAALALGTAGLACIALGGSLRLPAAATAEVPGVTLRLVQAGIQQQQKWRDDQRLRNLEAHLRLSAEDDGAITHWIWPETAIPYFLTLEPAALRMAGELTQGRGLLLAGALRRTAPGVPEIKIWNSLHAVGAEGVVGTYDKRHLVPFGEYLPLRGLLGGIGLGKLTHGSLDFAAGEDDGMLDLPGLPPVRVLICYESIFASEISPAGRRPGWLLNVTNDAWFGSSSGPYQHFAMARARAVEQGVALVRAANTGISGIVDPYGRVVASLGLGRVGVVDGPLPAPLPEAPLYARLGDWMLALLVACAAVLAAALGRRARR